MFIMIILVTTIAIKMGSFFFSKAVQSPSGLEDLPTEGAALLEHGLSAGPSYYTEISLNS